MKRGSWRMWALAWAVLAGGCASQPEKPAQAPAAPTPGAQIPAATPAQPGGEGTPELRQPFVLRLYLDAKHGYEVNFDQPVPYVYHNNVFIFPGESFGLKLHVENGKIKTVTYRKETAGADITLEFRQMMKDDKLKGSMMLQIQNHADKDVYMDAVMRVPQRKGTLTTSILPVMAGKGDFEMWPHPIVGLVLTNLRFEK